MLALKMSPLPSCAADRIGRLVNGADDAKPTAPNAVTAIVAAAIFVVAASGARAQGTREEQVAAGLYETGLAPQMPTDADCPEMSVGFGTQLNRSGRKRTEAHGTIHAGVDRALPEGTPVVAIADGHVTEIGEDFVRGNYVAIGHRGWDDRIYSSYVHYSRAEASSNV